MPASILIYGHDSKLLETRAWVLERAGFRVLRAASYADARHTLGREAIDLFIVCHTLLSREAEDVLADAHSDKPGVRSLLLTADTAEYTEDEANGVLSAFADPRMLIAKARELISTSECLATSSEGGGVPSVQGSLPRS